MFALPHILGLAVFLLSLASSVEAQQSNCSVICYEIAWGNNYNGCFLTDYTCNCKNKALIQSWADCEYQKCAKEDIETDIPLGIAGCKDLGAPITITTGQATATATSSATSSHSASGTAAAASGSSSASSSPLPEGDNNLSGGAIAGITIGVVVVVVGFIALGLFVWWRQRNGKNFGGSPNKPYISNPQMSNPSRA